MSKYCSTPFILITILLTAVFRASAQDGTAASSSQTLKCLRDLGSSVNVLASAKYDGAKLVGVELQFNNLSDGSVLLAPERIRFYNKNVEMKLMPSSVEARRESRQTVIQYTFPATRVANVAVVFLEGAVKSDQKDIGIRTNFGIPAPIGADALVTSVQPTPCENGLANWTPKDYLSSRLMSKENGVGLEAAVEAIGNVEAADPGNLLMASYWIMTAENPKLGMEIFFKAMYRLRFGTASGNNMALAYFLAATGPVVANYSLSHTQQLLQALQETIDWDNRTFLQWTAAMGIDPKDVGLQKRRKAARTLTQELIGNLKIDPKKFAQDLQKYCDP